MVGVVGNVRHYGPLGPLGSEIYIPYGQRQDRRLALTIVVRRRPSMTLSSDALRQAADAVGPRVWAGPIRTAAEDLQRRVMTPHRRTFLLGLLGGLGLLLTLVGISSTTAYAVARRTREVGIRIALGAQPRSVVRSMVRETAVAAAIGLVLGSAGALYATRIIASFLFETTPHDPVTFAAVAALTGLSALVAAWVPARRAARVDPVVALRAE